MLIPWDFSTGLNELERFRKTNATKTRFLAVYSVLLNFASIAMRSPGLYTTFEGQIILAIYTVIHVTSNEA